MDISQAVQVLTQAITNKSGDVSALQLALSILNNTYSADLTSLATSKAEADKNAADLSAANASLDTANATIDTLNGQVSDLTAQVDTANSQIADLTSQVATLSVTPAQPADPAQPDPAINATQ